MTVTDIDTQRRRDGAFFEDWSPWRSLGGWPQYTSHPVGKRPTRMPHFGCDLRAGNSFMGGAGFDVSLPQDEVCESLIRAIAGARKYPEGWLRGAPVRLWFVPAESWQALRAALPAIKARIVSKCGDPS